MKRRREKRRRGGKRDKEKVGGTWGRDRKREKWRVRVGEKR